jgi:hypothetical protein
MALENGLLRAFHRVGDKLRHRVRFASGLLGPGLCAWEREPGSKATNLSPKPQSRVRGVLAQAPTPPPTSPPRDWSRAEPLRYPDPVAHWDALVSERPAWNLAVLPGGGIWFTDPSYGIRSNYEGFRGESEVKEAVYEPKTGQIDKVTDEAGQPNGICFSPDYKKVYIADTGRDETSRSTTSTARCFEMESVTSSSTFQAPARRLMLTAFDATSTATSGLARHLECRLSRRAASG